MPQLPEWLDVVLRSGVIYLFIVGLLRLAGKRHAGQLSAHDLVVMLLVANAVQTAMVGPSVSLGAGLAAATVLIALNVALSRFVLRHRRLRPLIVGVPTLLIHNGAVISENLERERITAEELEAQLRAHGYESTGEVKTAVQETDGSISVIGFALVERRLPALPSWFSSR